jgi:RNA polymerase sigma-70 factor (ECF subfamily)
MLAEGQALLDRAVARRKPGPFQLKAAIAALHSAKTRPGLAADRRALRPPAGHFEPTPVVRAEPCRRSGRIRRVPARRWRWLGALPTALDAYQPFHAAQRRTSGPQRPDHRRPAAYAPAIALPLHPPTGPS